MSAKEPWHPRHDYEFDKGFVDAVEHDQLAGWQRVRDDTDPEREIIASLHDGPEGYPTAYELHRDFPAHQGYVLGLELPDTPEEENSA